MTLIFTLLAWSCSGDELPVPTEEVAEQAQELPEPEPEVFDAFPYPELLPSPGALSAQSERAGLGEAISRFAQETKLKTDVVVKSLAASRTGAEIASLLLEAKHADLETAQKRLERIEAGLAVFCEEPFAEQVVTALRAKLETQPSGEDWLQELERWHQPILEKLTGAKDHPQMALAVSGAWLQASWLVSSALKEKQELSLAREMLHRPLVGEYFDSYVRLQGPNDFPETMLNILKESLDKVRESSEAQPIEMHHIETIRKSTEGVLGMM